MDLTKIVDTTVSDFDSAATKAQKILLKEVSLLVKDLDVSGGRIKSTVSNLRTISKIQSKLLGAVLSPEYKKAVNSLLKSFSDVQSQQMGAFKDISKDFKTNEKYSLLKSLAVENTAKQLTESGIEANVTQGIKDMLLKSVVTGGNYTDLVDGLHDYLTDSETKAGALTRYAKTYASTALSQFVGESNKLMVDDANIEWFRYVGSNKTTTRDWCVHMTKKEWVHKSEFAEIISGVIDGKEVEIYDKTGLPKGMIEGTDENNILVNRGGWGCQHQFTATDSRIVPESEKERIKAKLSPNSFDKEIEKYVEAENAIIDKKFNHEKMFELFKLNNTKARDGINTTADFKRRFGDVSLEEAYTTEKMRIHGIHYLQAKVDAFEKYLINNGYGGKQSNVSESRYYKYKGVTYRFSSHIHPTGSMTDRTSKKIDLTADKHLINDIIK